MAASSSKSFQTQVQDDLLRCPICCSRYVNPRVLKCQHTFCYRCLQGCLKNAKGTKNLKCAVCRKETPLTKNGVVDIPKNLVVAGLLQMLKKSGTSDTSSSNKTKQQTEKSKNPATKSGIKSNAMKTTSDKNKNYSSKKKQEIVDSDEEYRRVYRREYTPTDDDSDTDDSSSDDYSSGDDHCCCCGCNCCDSSSYDDSSDYTSYDDSSESSDAYPLTPKMKSSRGIRLYSKIWVFAENGSAHKGVLHVLEKVKPTGQNKAKVFAGVALERQNHNLVTEDIDNMKNSFLYYWLLVSTFPRTVVGIDQCFSRRLAEKLLQNLSVQNIA